ncbi:MAG: DNA-3-methyladenine glycosylase I, partial [Patescibacteria group bacterium]
MDISQDKKTRCPWCLATPEYIEYHDTEWGVPTHDDARHFEFLILEAAQAGLSWLTILRKRQAYKIAFADFDANIVATYGEKEINKLLLNEGIIRNRMKITAAINNAQHFLQI